jgi:hypothetical protein
MQYISGISRHQMRIASLEDVISSDNQVRFIDVFVSYLDIYKLGFTVQTSSGARLQRVPTYFYELNEAFATRLNYPTALQTQRLNF